MSPRPYVLSGYDGGYANIPRRSHAPVVHRNAETMAYVPSSDVPSAFLFNTVLIFEIFKKGAFTLLPLIIIQWSVAARSVVKPLLAPPIAAVCDGPTTVPAAAFTMPLRARTQLHCNRTRDSRRFDPIIGAATDLPH
ncbi:hypothetical protein RB195_006036 [Necator americanus]|uniref:Uncharacterized protein n=1 Tax=Necator americanus TaxID=51031 RepID=A0ABR1BUF8_NECAM